MTTSFDNLDLEPVKTVRASEAIYEQIKSRILSGALRPGDRLPSERQLMEMLGRSRPTIREALRMLERDGFLRISPGAHGAIVQKFDTANIEQPLETMLRIGEVTITELYEFRMQCECTIAGWAAQRRGETDIQQLGTLIAEAERLLAKKDYSGFLLMDASFHQSLAKASKNEVACIITGVFQTITERFLTPALERKSPAALKRTCQSMLDGHREIVLAVESGDEGRARQAMVAHLDAFSSEFESAPL